MWYRYVIYGKKVLSNIDMPLLNETYEDSPADLSLSVEFGDLPSCDKVLIDYSDHKYSILLGDLAWYTIDYLNSSISCVAKNKEVLFSTLFNIPFSIYFTVKGDILLHACTLLHDKNLIGIAGNKGIGKSTLSCLLSFSPLSQYSDDTIRITYDHIAYRAHNLTKHTAETAELFNEDYQILPKNITNKIYVSLSPKSEPKFLHSVIQLQRGNSIRFERIESDVIKRQIYVRNIVGVEWFNKDLLKIAYSNDQFKNMKVFKLIVPNNLQFLADNKIELQEMIINNMLDI